MVVTVVVVVNVVIDAVEGAAIVVVVIVAGADKAICVVEAANTPTRKVPLHAPHKKNHKQID